MGVGVGEGDGLGEVDGEGEGEGEEVGVGLDSMVYILLTTNCELTTVFASFTAIAVQEDFRSTTAGSSRIIVKPFVVTAAIIKSCFAIDRSLSVSRRKDSHKFVLKG